MNKNSRKKWFVSNQLFHIRVDIKLTKKDLVAVLAEHFALNGPNVRMKKHEVGNIVRESVFIPSTLKNGITEEEDLILAKHVVQKLFPEIT